MSSASFQIELTPEPLPARTDLAHLPFAVLLANARMLRLTGVLELRGEKRIFISRGSPINVESDLADETSELYLLHSGAVDASDIEPARELARSRGGKIGEALLGLGVLEANELFEHTRNRARDALIACFGWERGSANWEPRERFGPEVLPVPIDVVRTFFDGILRFYDRRRLDAELPVDDGSRVYVVPNPRIEVAAAHVGTVETRLLQLAQGRPSLPSAAMAVGISADELRRRLYALYCLGVVGFEVDPPLLEPDAPAAPAPAPPPVASGHVPRAGTTGKWPTISTSPGTQAPPRPVTSPGSRDPRRDSTIPPPPRPSQVPPAPRASEIPPRPSQVPAPRASQLPSPPLTRTPSSPGFVPPQRASQLPPPPAPAAARPAAAPRGRAAAPKASFGPHAVVKTGRPTKSVQAYIEDAELARTQKDWEAAYLALEYALELEPENAFIWAEKAYTMMRHDPRAFGKEANALARDARKADPGLPMPYVVLGMLMEQIRETERAVQMYRVALQKDPVCEPAQTLLEQIEVKRGR